MLLLRFEAALTPEAEVCEAYILLERARQSDNDAPVLLHAARVVDAWSGGTVSWPHQPRVEDVDPPHGAPVTRATPTWRGFVRLDVKKMVVRWQDRHGADFGVAIIGEGEGTTGMAFSLLPTISSSLEGTTADPLLAMRPVGVDPAPAEPRIGASFPESSREPAGPKLELYVNTTPGRAKCSTP
jgi:hypothetical protein